MNEEKKMAKKIVVIGGGNGSSVLLKGLKDYDVELTSITNVTDSGGNTGKMKYEMNILPVGDARRCLSALSADDSLGELFDYRLEEGSLAGYVVGNVFLAAATKAKGNFEEAIGEAEKFLQAKGKVIPVTLDSVELCAEFENGEIVEKEHNITGQKGKIKRLFLKPEANANPKAIKAIKEADLIIIAMGNLYVSVLPNILILANAIKNSKAKKLYVCNLLTTQNTPNYTVNDHLKLLQDQTGKMDYLIVNSSMPKETGALEKKNQLPVRDDSNTIKDTKVLKGEILKNGLVDIKNGDIVKNRSLLIHDSEKLAKMIMGLLK